MVVALDFATRRVIESTQEDGEIRRRLLKDSVEHLKRVEEMYKEIQQRSEMSYQRLRTEVSSVENVLLKKSRVYFVVSTVKYAGWSLNAVQLKYCQL